MVMMYEDLGTAVNQAFENMKRDFTIVFFREQIAGPMDLAISSVVEYVRNYKHGIIYGSASLNPQQRNTRLEKTSVFLYALGFSEDDEFQGRVINGIRERAAERGDQFEYPPPEDKRISYEEIKQIYSAQNNVVEGGSADEQNKEESMEDRVNRLLTMPISDKPDKKYKYRDMIARRVYIEDFADNYINFGSGITIKVTPQRSETGEALHSDTYRIYYHGERNGEGVGVRTWRALKEFLSERKGREARIVYNRYRSGLKTIPTIQMIAPFGSEIIYFRDCEIIKPYNDKEMRFIGV